MQRYFGRLTSCQKMPELRPAKFLVACLVLINFGCNPTVVKYVDPEGPIRLESNEKIVLGQVVLAMHFKNLEEVSFPPIGLGLLNAETGERATPPKFATMIQPWFDSDGFFIWKLKKGNYRIDALSWGCDISLLYLSSEVNLPKPMRPPGYHLAAEPDKPGQCGYVVNPNVAFTVSGDSDVLYLGTLRIDLDVETNRGIAVKNINSVEVIDSFDATRGLFKDRFPGESSAFERSLMSCSPGQTGSFSNGPCPAGVDRFVRLLLGIISGGATHMGPGAAGH